jgi:hypothetical protein
VVGGKSKVGPTNSITDVAGWLLGFEEEEVEGYDLDLLDLDLVSVLVLQFYRLK